MERRGAIEFRAAAGNRLEGYAALYNSPSADLGGFTEVIRPGAFTASLAASPDVLALYEHDTRHVLGRTSAGTLKLAEDQTGLLFSVEVPPTSIGRDVLVSVERGDIRGASFAFRAQKDRWTEGYGGMMRELLAVDLLDITITASPAYPDTSVARRALERAASPLRLVMLNRYLETMEAF